jgi:hypothetical protein
MKAIYPSSNDCQPRIAYATTVEIGSGHLSLITHPHEMTQLILDAVHAVRRQADPAGTSRSLTGGSDPFHVLGSVSGVSSVSRA